MSLFRKISEYDFNETYYGKSLLNTDLWFIMAYIQKHVIRNQLFSTLLSIQQTLHNALHTPKAKLSEAIPCQTQPAFIGHLLHNFSSSHLLH